MDRPIRIVLVDDHAVMRAALCSLLDARAEFSVVGEADNGREALAVAAKAAPDVVVMDINIPELNGIDATRQLCARFPHMKVIGLSVHTKGRMVSEMLDAGAMGYVPKSSAAQDLINAIRSVMAGNMYVSPEVLGDFVELRSRAAPGKSAFEKLTGREREVLQLLAEGNSTKEAAEKLCLSVPTIHTHRQHVMEKLGARSIADLVRYAIREGIISADC
ncbi:Transcriptional regulatory protein DegU [Pontiella desulfatans]|uniref:Transcriptional regulatory protein DegU n=1 Tax=Pontiella desulfatans TaxID=2750659 RepID=A0A6C2UBI3_PONDE|nr:response regulator transcription factor [Pontiella desulfatans]VGO17299.1 Transcriptional regulatory protein DegU [Pontiella desulfatans]